MVKQDSIAISNPIKERRRSSYSTIFSFAPVDNTIFAISLPASLLPMKQFTDFHLIRMDGVEGE